MFVCFFSFLCLFISVHVVIFCSCFAGMWKDISSNFIFIFIIIIMMIVVAVGGGGSSGVATAAVVNINILRMMMIKMMTMIKLVICN